jgi:hypothetical protein
MAGDIQAQAPDHDDAGTTASDEEARSVGGFVSEPRVEAVVDAVFSYAYQQMWRSELSAAEARLASAASHGRRV